MVEIAKNMIKSVGQFYIHDKILVISVKLILLALRNPFISSKVGPSEIEAMRVQLVYLL